MLDMPPVLEIIYELQTAQRPVLIFGAGVRYAEEEAREFGCLMDVPICTTWGARDLFPDCVGAFGTHGVPAANRAIQESDYVLVLGSRLDTKATGYPVSSFAPDARLVMVDIDPAELAKMEKIGRPLYRSILCDLKRFIGAALRQYVKPHDGFLADSDHSGWWARIEAWKSHSYTGPQYAFITQLSASIPATATIVCDTGCSLAWMMQAYRFKGERFLHPFNQTPMGCGLGYALGAASNGEEVWCITGDGGLSLGISELATIVKNQLDVKIVVLNNKGHAMCRQTQRQWMDGEYPATSADGGLPVLDFVKIAKGYGIASYAVQYTVFPVRRGPVLYEVQIPPECGVDGQVKFGEPLVKEAA